MSYFYPEHCNNQFTNIHYPICNTSKEPAKPAKNHPSTPEKSPEKPAGFLVEHILEFLERYSPKDICSN
jgi:hypothetical protein